MPCMYQQVAWYRLLSLPLLPPPLRAPDCLRLTTTCIANHLVALNADLCFFATHVSEAAAAYLQVNRALRPLYP